MQKILSLVQWQARPFLQLGQVAFTPGMLSIVSIWESVSVIHHTNRLHSYITDGEKNILQYPTTIYNNNSYLNNCQQARNRKEPSQVDAEHLQKNPTASTMLHSTNLKLSQALSMPRRGQAAMTVSSLLGVHWRTPSSRHCNKNKGLHSEQKPSIWNFSHLGTLKDLNRMKSKVLFSLKINSKILLKCK